MNLIWILLGGLLLALEHGIIGLIFCITLIGIPFGKQHFKLAAIALTPFGREIADILLAVNRSYNKSDYIPCIAWGRNASFCQNLVIGSKIRLTGRIQSREYKKRISDDEFVTKTAYEVSIVKLEEYDDIAEEA